MNSEGGWPFIKALLPEELSQEQRRVYIGLSVYIDRVVRPFYGILTSSDGNDENNASRSSHAICEVEATMKLLLAGVNIGVDELIDVVTGGAGAALVPLEGLALGAELTSIWLDYERCNGRWHDQGIAQGGLR